MMLYGLMSLWAGPCIERNTCVQTIAQCDGVSAETQSSNRPVDNFTPPVLGNISVRILAQDLAGVCFCQNEFFELFVVLLVVFIIKQAWAFDVAILPHLLGGDGERR
ncbi:hypothetical protein HG530_003887 [Fusarium avenaceum]|nr:hypothetical protein HG530_003887 [Fusarium avenaceum]